MATMSLQSLTLHCLLSFIPTATTVPSLFRPTVNLSPASMAIIFFQSFTRQAASNSLLFNQGEKSPCVATTVPFFFKPIITPTPREMSIRSFHSFILGKLRKSESSHTIVPSAFMPMTQAPPTIVVIFFHSSLCSCSPTKVPSDFNPTICGKSYIGTIAVISFQSL